MTIRLAVAACALALCVAPPAFAQTGGPGADGGRFYGRAEYLWWQVKDGPQSQPLVTTGLLSTPSTAIVMGGDDVDFGHQNGVRLTLGYWLTADRTWGLEASGFYLPTVTERAAVASSGQPGSLNLRVPFFDVNRNAESSTNVSSAGNFSGIASEDATSRLWGVEGNAVFGLGGASPVRLELLGGFRYLNLKEGFSFRTSSPDLPPGPVTVFDTRDAFDARNDFYGGQLGVRGRYQAGRFMADATLRVAVGAMRQNVDVSGSTRTNFFGPPAVQTFAGGIFAEPTNIGSFSRTVSAVVPEAGINLGFRVTDWAAIVVGYTFLYASNVARPGNQIDRAINPTQSVAIGTTNPPALSGPARPAFRFEGSDFWAHGLNAGIALTF